MDIRGGQKSGCASYAEIAREREERSDPRHGVARGAGVRARSFVAGLGGMFGPLGEWVWRLWGCLAGVRVSAFFMLVPVLRRTSSGSWPGFSVGIAAGWGRAFFFVVGYRFLAGRCGGLCVMQRCVTLLVFLKRMDGLRLVDVGCFALRWMARAHAPTANSRVIDMGMVSVIVLVKVALGAMVCVARLKPGTRRLVPPCSLCRVGW